MGFSCDIARLSRINKEISRKERHEMEEIIVKV
jgi:hypothetical protein